MWTKSQNYRYTKVITNTWEIMRQAKSRHIWMHNRDVNNLYRWATSQKVSVESFKWWKSKFRFAEEFIKNYNENSDKNIAQKIKFYIKDFFSKCDQICSLLRIWSHLLKKFLTENLIVCAVKGYTFEVDVKYLKKLYKLHSDLKFLLEIMNFMKKLDCNLYSKKNCVKSVQILSYFCSVFSCIQSKYRKIWTRNNSVFGHFSHSMSHTHKSPETGIKSWICALKSTLVIEFSQEAELKPCIESNTELKTKAKTNSEKGFFTKKALVKLLTSEKKEFI